MEFESVTIGETNFAEGADGSVTISEWEYNQVKELQILFKPNGDPGRVRITVPAGLNITSYTSEGSEYSKVETAQHTDLPSKYTSEATASVTYTVNSTITQGNIYVNIGVDRVLWPKTESWTTGAIKVELLPKDGGDTAYKTQSAKAVIIPSKSESAVYNVIQADANASVPAKADTPFRLKTYQVIGNQTGTPMGGYFRSVTVTMPVPYDTNSGNYYATYARVESNYSSALSVDSTSAANALTLTWNDIYITPGTNLNFTPYFTWGTERTADGTGGKNQIKLNNGPTATLVFFDGTSLSNVRQNDAQTNFDLVTTIPVVNSGTTQYVYNWYGSDPNKVYQFGQFLVENTGFVNSGPLKLIFTYSNNDQAGVTAQRIPGTVTDVQYETRDGSGLQDGMSLLKDNTLFAPSGKYFTQIVATVAGLEPGAGKYYNHSASLSPGNQCVTFGKLLQAGAFTVSNVATLKIEKADGNINSVNVPTVAAHFNLTVQDTEEAIPLTLGPASGKPLLNITKVEAGSAVNTAHFTGVISTTSYPYGNNVTAMNPVIYVRLPNGVTMDKLTIKSGETAVTPASQMDYSDRGGEGFHVYEISFAESQGQVGWFKEDLTETSLTLEFDIVASIEAGNTSLPMRDCVLIAYSKDLSLNKENYGSLDANIVLDAHDVDGDRDTGEKLCSVQDFQSMTLAITPARRGLHFEARAKLGSETDETYYNYSVSSDNPNLKSDNKIMYLTQDNDTIEFQLTAENNTGTVLDVEALLKAEEAAGTSVTDFFCYYVPIPKINDYIDAHFQPSPFELNTVLNEDDPCEVTYNNWTDAPSDAFTVQYGKVDSGTYNNSLQYHADYVSGNEGDNMVRITLKDGVNTIPKDAKVTVTLHYEFHLDTGELVGQYVEFGACGQSLYTTAGTPSQGHSPTQRIRAELQTGRIAGRVFIDADYTGSYTDKDYFIEFEPSENPELEHGAFLDRNKDGVKDAGETTVSMELYATSGSGVKHYAQKPTFDSNKFENTYAISSLRAEDYTLTVTNPSYTAGAPGEHSLRFIQLQEETESSRVNKEKAPASTYTPGYQENTTATIRINATDVTNNRMRDIGFQLPHKVTFEVTYTNEYGVAPAAPSKQTIYVWDNETIESSGASIPSFGLDSDFQWENGSSAVWKLKDGEGTLDADTPITGDVTYTATAVRMQHSVIYDDNWTEGEARNMPSGPNNVVNGQSVKLSTQVPTRSADGDKPVVFIGWTKDADKPIEARGESKKSVKDLGCIDSVTMGTADITLYALWGYDENGDGMADVLEDRYTLRYDLNGGEGELPAEQKELLPDTVVTLDTAAKPTRAQAIFLGWSTAKHELVTSQADE